MARSRAKSALDWAFPVLLLALLIGGALAGALGLPRAADEIGLLDVEPALRVPAAITGIAVGGMTGLAVALFLATAPTMLRERGIGGTGLVVLGAVGATALGAVLYLGLVGGLVWLAGLVLPAAVTLLIAVVLSIAGLPFAGPIAYQLISGRRADEVGGGVPTPRWVSRIRRRPRRP
ncbi:hypothetical protein WEI85_11340 [Actinomycetes bacterium KLBMP 9797]